MFNSYRLLRRHCAPCKKPLHRPKNARIGTLKSKLVEIGTLNQKYRVDAPFTAIKPQDYRGLNNRNTYRLRFRVPISNCFIAVAFYGRLGTGEK